MSKAILVAGLAWGDESKGSCVDYLCRKHNAKLLVRYNGGSQAAHNVVLPDGTHHTFSQFGSGSLIHGVKTFLSSYMLVNPIAMEHERQVLSFNQHGIEPPMVSEKCLVITPFDVELNKLRENINQHGTCGRGIGETRLYHNTYGDEALFVGDLKNSTKTSLKLRLKQLRAIDIAKSLSQKLPENILGDTVISQATSLYYHWTFNVLFTNDYSLIYHMQDAGCTVFEGAQGVLLDERDEFAPHNTWTKTTFENADKLLDDMSFIAGLDGEIIRVGCLRAYMTRHGAGPFPTEDARLSELSEPHNRDDGFQGKFRRGHFDMASVKRALDICGGVDEIHMSHLDQLPKIYGSVGTDSYVSNIERLLETPITVTGHGPTFEDRRERDAKGVVARRRVVKTVSGLSLCTEGKEPEGQSISSGQDEVQNA